MNSSDICVDCTAGCQTCDPDTLICSQCKENYTLNEEENVCECNNGTYLVRASAMCLDCNEACLTCSGKSEQECTSCKTEQERVLVGNTCNCRENYQEPETGKICVIVDPKTCEPGYSYVETEGSCKATCGDGKVIAD